MNYIKSFFISVWCLLIIGLFFGGCDLAQEVANKAGNKPDVNALIVFCIDLPMFFAAVLLIGYPIYQTFKKHTITTPSIFS